MHYRWNVNPLRSNEAARPGHSGNASLPGSPYARLDVCHFFVRHRLLSINIRFPPLTKINNPFSPVYIIRN